ncbi:glycine/D-amino acid oxidase-like deaminating enzyme [Lipingzhangella halophila]|uniref:Glycine/D-amino acid oxidase-like deaminating enzyme n=1 Tax=Lipingzhangella halophila TaxID=1783352 RepID=A0A7W7RIJ2_9ACTN|nr:FAD-dependent oxidoreductase [Lipingzhangella halophila]MBB4932635.1 glycine/D-amino acid oxidase-like deaminating enzyme [Lipingzhangella halophila]
MRIAIVGAGVLGLSVARELAGNGDQVTVYEADRPGAGTSGTTFAWVNSHTKEPTGYHELNVAGVRAHHARIAGGSGAPFGFHPSGTLEWAETAEHDRALRSAVDRLRRRDYPAELIDARHARALEPGARGLDSARSVAVFASEGYVLPAEFLGTLLTDALARGVRLVCPVRVRELGTTSGAARIALDDGSTAEADIVISAVGRWTGELAATAGCSVPMAHPDGPATAGYLAYTDPVPARLARPLTTSWLNVRPDGGGRLVLQALDFDTEADAGAPAPGPDSAMARELRERLAAVLVGGEYARIAEVRVGQRALPADGLTVCGFADDHRRLYVVTTHSGVTLAPALAPMVAGEVRTGTPAAMLAEFRPGRFTAGERSAGGSSGTGNPGRQ